MVRVRDASKQRYWRRLIKQQGQSKETVARFCAREGLAVHQFYWWQRRLRAGDGQLAEVGVGQEAGGDLGREEEPAAESFVPVRLPILTSTPIELVHPGGWVVRVPVGFDPLSLRRLLATLTSSPADPVEP